MTEPYTVQLQFVPRDLFALKIAIARERFTMPLCAEPDEVLTLIAPHCVTLELLPVEPLEGIIGYAAWALVGDTLHGVVQEGPDAGFVASWLTAHLDLMLAYLQGGRRGLVEAHQVEDARRGTKLRDQLSARLLDDVRRRAALYADRKLAGHLDIISPTLADLTRPTR